MDNNNFIIENNLKYSNYTVICSKCNSYIDNFLSIEEAQRIKQNLDNKLKNFEIDIDIIKDTLIEVKCPQCQSDLFLNVNVSNLTYMIRCLKCNSNYDNYDNLLTDYKPWKQKAAMMIKIKAKEDEILQSRLNNKKIDDIKIKTEKLIKGEDSMDTIEYFADNRKSLDDNQFFIELFKRIKVCSRLAKVLLINICELINQSNNELSKWSYSNSNELATETRYIKSDEPVVPLLQDITKILPIRKTLRELIQQNLIYCDEEKNALHVHPSLLANLSSIKNLLKPQNISNELSWLIFTKQNFTCYHCGENGRPLKIDYLNFNKDNNHLSNMIGICDSCYSDVTENEVLIDAMISGTEEYYNESPISWKFLTTNYNDFENVDEAYGINLNLVDRYNEIDIIKAYAATINKFYTEINKVGIFAYAEAILHNSIDGVRVSNKISNNYKIEEWLKKLD